MTSTITYGAGVGSGVRVGEIRFVGGEEVVAVAVAAVAAREAHADNAVIPSRRLNKKYFLMVENLRAASCALIACGRRRELVFEIEKFQASGLVLVQIPTFYRCIYCSFCFLKFYLRSTTLSFHKPPWFADK